MAYEKQTWANGDVITANKLNHIENGIDAIVEMELDDTLSVTGKAADAKTVGDMLETKAEIDGAYEGMTVGNAEQLVSTVFEEDQTPYVFRTAGGSIDIGDRETDKIVGGTVAWNQIYPTPTTQAVSTKAFNSGTTFVTGHKMLHIFNASKIDPDGSTPRIYIYLGKDSGYSKDIQAGSALIFSQPNSVVADGTANNNANSVWVYIVNSSNCTWNSYVMYDLTQMFGTTIADYIYSLEQSTAGSGVAFFKKLFPKPYYAYDAGTLMHVSGLVSHDLIGFNAYDTESGKAKVVGNQQYQITGTYTSLSLNGETVTADASGYFTPDASGELTVTGGASDTCVHLVWDGERDGEYEEYEVHSYALDDSLTLRGIPKLDSANNLYYDGDVYQSDGTVTRRYGIVDLGTLTYSLTQSGLFRTNGINDYKRPANSSIKANVISIYTTITSQSITGPNGANPSPNMVCAFDATGTLYLNNTAYTDVATFKTAMSGVYLVYELATPTEEQAEPYTNPQIVDDFGTEEYVISTEADVIVPVGHVTQYAANLRAKLEMLPDSPDGNGDYIMRQVSGENSFVPLTKELPTAPSEDGTYVLKCTVTSGTPVLSWETES